MAVVSSDSFPESATGLWAQNVLKVPFHGGGKRYSPGDPMMIDMRLGPIYGAASKNASLVANPVLELEQLRDLEERAKRSASFQVVVDRSDC